jgi:BirA family biotin operon repressor/biotin-[acetyl-CoA-carboxylase] ligase
VTEVTFSRASILESLPSSIRERLESFEVFQQLPSTNTYLMGQPAPSAGMGRVALADHQTAGRGRRQSTWLSSPNAGICLSIAFTLQRSAKDLPALTLALGVGAVRALGHRGISGARLKWPNDIVFDDNKLGGILCELKTVSGGETSIVAGIGLNVKLPPELKAMVMSDWADEPADLSLCPDDQQDRNVLVTALIGEWLETMTVFAVHGLEPFLAAWRDLDWLQGRAIEIDQAGSTLSGVASGISDDGELLISLAGKLYPINSGGIRLCSQ